MPTKSSYSVFLRKYFLFVLFLKEFVLLSWFLYEVCRTLFLSHTHTPVFRLALVLKFLSKHTFVEAFPMVLTSRSLHITYFAIWCCFSSYFFLFFYARV